MIRNYLKIAWRNLVKNKIFSFINIAGLASGLACFMLIALYVTDELGYDKYNKNAGRIYRINSDVTFGGNSLHMATAPDPMGAVLKKDYPQVEEYVRFYAPMGIMRMKKGNEYIRETKTVYADSTLFNVFTLPAVAGDTRTALNEPNTVVISESAAKRYFGNGEAVGKTIVTGENERDIYKVTTVIKDIPANSHFNFDFIFSMDNVEYSWGSFLSNNFQTYILLRPGTEYKEFEKNFQAVINRYVLPQAKKIMNVNSIDEFEKAGNKLRYSLMPLTSIHLHSDRTDEMGVNGSMEYVYIFSMVSFFVLLLACINFMNLSTARSAGRAREVGIRKVLGTGKSSLIGQFLTESTIMAFIAAAAAAGIAAICIPYFNELAAKDFTISYLFRPGFLLFLLLLPAVVGILSGLYPAFFLSSFRPIAVLKGKQGTVFRRSTMRNALVVFQFFTTIVLIAGTIVVYRQLNFIQTKRLGFNKDQVLIVRGTMALGNNKDAFREKVSGLSGITAAANAGFLPVANSSRTDNTFSTEAVMNSDNGFNMQVWDIDEKYLPLMGMELKEGRNFSKDMGTEKDAVLLNEAAIRTTGLVNPVGKKIYTWEESDSGLTSRVYTIAGVVRDFHYESMRENIGPLCFRYGKSDWAMAFRISPGNVQQLVSNVEAAWKQMAPGQPFIYTFMDQSFDDMYRTEQRTGRLSFAFAILAILIACLGLFGLAAYMTEQRIKEIGIRKVLGASVSNLTLLLSGSFVRMVLIAALLAIPVAWWAMNKWLRDFAYRITISWWVFALAGFTALFIALLTVSIQAAKAALSNPVKSLRSE